MPGNTKAFCGPVIRHLISLELLSFKTSVTIQSTIEQSSLCSEELSGGHLGRMFAQM